MNSRIFFKFSIFILIENVFYLNAFSKNAFDNSIIGEPYISCERDQIVVEIITEKRFNGKIFVKGEYSNPECSQTFRDGKKIKENDESKESEVLIGTVTRSSQQKINYSIKKSSLIEKLADDSKNTKTSINESDWRSVGGATLDQHAAFGGSKGEEFVEKRKIDGDKFQVFNKNQQNQKQKENLEKNCGKPTFCEPCKCGEEEKRLRRATNSIRFIVPINSCNSKRDRKLNPPSLVISFVAMITFHNNFITKLDKAYHIQCAYAETEKEVSTDLDVSISDEETELTSIIEGPTCEYLISDQNGIPTTNGIVGELVKHQWLCKGGIGKKLRMLVHDCFVIDFGGEQSMIIDENGCSKDEYTLQTPKYSENGLTAEVDAYIFKFPDKSTIDFKCSITFCSIDNDGCDSITPPKCFEKNESIRKKRSNRRSESMTLHSNSLTVFDIDVDLNENAFSASNSSFLFSFENISSSFCMSISSFGLLISAATFFFTISFALIFSYFFIKFNHKFLIEQ